MNLREIGNTLLDAPLWQLAMLAAILYLENAILGPSLTYLGERIAQRLEAKLYGRTDA